MGTKLPSAKKVQSPPPNFCPCLFGQTPEWIKMPLGTEIDLGSGDSVSDGDPAPLPKRRRSPSPQFSVHVYCNQTAGWIKVALGMEVCLSPGDIVLDGDPAPPPQRRGLGVQPPNFWSMSIVAKWQYVSGYHLVRTPHAGSGALSKLVILMCLRFTC